MNLLVETLEAAIDHPDRLTPGEIGFTATSLATVPLADYRFFVNESSLGVGRDRASVVVMGTEPAEDPEDPEEMAWHALYSVLVAAGSRPEIVDRIVAGTSWVVGNPEAWNTADKRPYHLNPNDFIHVERRGGTRTWKVLAQVLAPGSAVAWRALLDTRLDAPGLGEHAYQVDRSAVPAMKSSRGQPPSDDRVGFLVDVLGRLRRTARLLLLHGFGGPGRWGSWWAQDQKLIRAFLGRPEGHPIELEWRKVGGRHSLASLSEAGRRVIYSRALNGQIPHIEAVRAEVAQWLP